MTVSKQVKLRGRGGPGRGQGRKSLKHKRVKVSVNIPPSMLEKIKALQDVTGDTLSGTMVWVLDHGLSITKKR